MVLHLKGSVRVTWVVCAHSDKCSGKRKYIQYNCEMYFIIFVYFFSILQRMCKPFLQASTNGTLQTCSVHTHLTIRRESPAIFICRIRRKSLFVKFFNILESHCCDFNRRLTICIFILFLVRKCACTHPLFLYVSCFISCWYLETRVLYTFLRMLRQPTSHKACLCKVYWALFISSFIHAVKKVDTFFSSSSHWICAI